jgi:rhodanese-related sulfurtransferase
VLGRIFHNAISAVLATLVHLGEYGLLLLAAALALYLVLRWIERQLFIRRMRMDRISVDELARMIDEGLNPVIFDVRHADTRSRDGIIPGAVGAHASDILAMLADYPRDAEIVVYCACPNEASAAIAALHLKRAGFRKIRPLLGGIEAWAGAGRPIVTA